MNILFITVIVCTIITAVAFIISVIYEMFFRRFWIYEKRFDFYVKYDLRTKEVVRVEREEYFKYSSKNYKTEIKYNNWSKIWE